MQYRIYQYGSLGAYLPTQILKPAQVDELKALGVFDMHLEAGRIVPVEVPLETMKDRSVIETKPLKSVDPDRLADPTKAYRNVGDTRLVPAPDDLQEDEVDELEKQLSDEPEAEGLPGGEIDLTDLGDD